LPENGAHGNLKSAPAAGHSQSGLTDDERSKPHISGKKFFDGACAHMALEYLLNTAFNQAARSRVAGKLDSQAGDG
jgi:hypothetical protein